MRALGSDVRGRWPALDSGYWRGKPKINPPYGLRCALIGVNCAILANEGNEAFLEAIFRRRDPRLR